MRIGATVQEEEWTNDLNAFVNEDDADAPMSMTLRSKCRDFLTAVVDQFGTTALSVVAASFGSLSEKAGALRREGKEYWWHLPESFLACIGTESEAVFEDEAKVPQRTAALDLLRIFQVGVLPYVNSSGARARSTLSRKAKFDD